MSNLNEIRADYDQNSLIVYQAYSAAIAKPALAPLSRYYVSR